LGLGDVPQCTKNRENLWGGLKTARKTKKLCTAIYFETKGKGDIQEIVRVLKKQ